MAKYTIKGTGDPELMAGTVEFEEKDGEKIVYVPQNLLLEKLENFDIGLGKLQNMMDVFGKAIGKFEAGLANYENAAVNLAALMDEKEKVEVIFLEQARKISQFYDPPGISSRFQTPMALATFASRAISALMDAVTEKPVAGAPATPSEK